MVQLYFIRVVCCFTAFGFSGNNKTVEVVNKLECTDYNIELKK